MKLEQINEASYSSKGGSRVAEVQYAIYDLKNEAFISENRNNQAGISRRYSMTVGDGISWFNTFEQAEQFLQLLREKISTTRYKEGSEYITRGNYRWEDKTIKLTARQAKAKNRMMSKREADLNALVIATVRATY